MILVDNLITPISMHRNELCIFPFGLSSSKANLDSCLSSRLSKDSKTNSFTILDSDLCSYLAKEAKNLIVSS